MASEVDKKIWKTLALGVACGIFVGLVVNNMKLGLGLCLLGSVGYIFFKVVKK
jgi:Na+/H+-dicarboxylate symporter